MRDVTNDQSTLLNEAGDASSEFSIWDPQNEASVINMVPEEIAKRLKEVHEASPEYFDKDEQELYSFLRHNKATPTATDNRLRLKFWYEYDRAKEAQSKLNVTNVISNVCSRELFYAHYLKRPTKVAWLLCPPTNYSHKISEALEFGLEQMRDILASPHVITDKDGNQIGIDHKLASLKLQVFKVLDDRKNGMAVQKVEKKSAHIHAVIPPNDRKLIGQMAQEHTEEDLLKKLEEAKRKERLALHVSDTEKS